MSVLLIPEKYILPQELVMKMFDAAISKAKELDIKICMAIVDDCGNLSGFIKMDGANLLPLKWLKQRLIQHFR